MEIKVTKKVYLLTEIEKDDSIETTNIQVFETLEKALKEFNKQVLNRYEKLIDTTCIVQCSQREFITLDNEYYELSVSEKELF